MAFLSANSARSPTFSVDNLLLNCDCFCAKIKYNQSFEILADGRQTNQQGFLFLCPNGPFSFFVTTRKIPAGLDYTGQKIYGPCRRFWGLRRSPNDPFFIKKNGAIDSFKLNLSNIFAAFFLF